MSGQGWTLLIIALLAGLYLIWRIRRGIKGRGGCCGDGCGCRKKR